MVGFRTANTHPTLAVLFSSVNEKLQVNLLLFPFQAKVEANKNFLSEIQYAR